MLEGTFKSLKCKTCKTNTLYYDMDATHNAYRIIEVLSADSISKVLDDMLLNFIVFRCQKCNSEYRYNMKELEKEIRKDLLTKIIEVEGRKFRAENNLISTPRVFVYCGRCSGLDGSGSCPIKYYEECLLKKVPYEL